MFEINPIFCCVNQKQFSNFAPINTMDIMTIHHIQVVLMDEALVFIRSLPSKVQEKITYNYKKIEHGVMDKELFKKLENSNIWEFRTLYNGNCYRLFSFWDTETETLIIATHGIVRKTQKTPAKEIAKAEEIRRKYFEQKNK